MSFIDKRKFLAELAKLLTFMYEEDRQTALSLYEKMFNDAEDEQALIQHLMSPTRQAVVVARAYNAKTRKLQVQSQAGSGEADVDSCEIPEFVQTINEVYNSAISRNIVLPADDEVDENQISFFDDLVESAGITEFEEPTPASVIKASPAPVKVSPVAAAPASDDEADEMDRILNSFTSGVATAVAASAASEAFEEDSPEEGFFEDVPDEEDILSDEAASADAEEDLSDGEDELDFSDDLFSDEADAAETEDVPEEEGDIPDDIGLSEFDTADSDVPAEEDAEAEQTVISVPSDSAKISPAAEVPANKQPKPVKAAPSAPDKKRPLTHRELDAAKANTVRKAMPVAIFFYVLIAIPVCAAAIAIILIPAAFFLACSCAAVAAGVFLISSVASLFIEFSSIFVVIGAALIALALGLLFLWIAVWFIGGAAVSVVNGVIKLCEKICYKEVPVK